VFDVYAWSVDDRTVSGQFGRVPSKLLTDRKLLGRTLRRLRETRKPRVSQEECAALAGIDRSYYGGIERGERRPSFEQVDRVIAGLAWEWRDFAAALDKERAAQKRTTR
jgi:transcriptional regulator with XRE-family HTH domain